MQNEATSENLEPQASTGAAVPVATTDSMRSPPAAAPRQRPKPGILRLDIGKPRRSSGGSVDFRCVGSSGSGSGSNIATGANSEVSGHELRLARECLRFGQANDMCSSSSSSSSNHGKMGKIEERECGIHNLQQKWQQMPIAINANRT
ncbi:uncharacterized protein LOC117580291 [Drosophila guanche]|uniref:uncharacterized protein LOC117580291 n=1 Tax=Drosophila guanche TaxID=7266 RepID=UPI0014714463|nr:uncharacterized protein LOC117580291 [Drosophila guanche]